jgi:ABC-type uncharacterized transport system auxiliary subunit
VAQNNARKYVRPLAIALICSGCAQILGGNAELPQRRFYDFGTEVVQSGLAQSERPYAVQVQVKTFDVQRAYNRTEIVFRRDQYELHRDPLHSWITRPGDLFTDAVQQYLRQADLFTYVGGDRDFYDRRPDYVLSGVVKAVERFDSGDVWAAHLAMSMELVRQEDALVVWQKDFDDERQVFFPEMKHTVAAFSQILGQQMETSMREIDFLFLNMKRGNSTEELNIDSLQVVPSNSVEDLKDNRLETDEEDYELIPGKIAQ